MIVADENESDETNMNVEDGEDNNIQEDCTTKRSKLKEIAIKLAIGCLNVNGLWMDDFIVNGSDVNTQRKDIRICK